MKESLEVRVPMLDEELFSFALTLPHKLKVKGRECKHVLREVAARQLPVSVAKKPKHGFAVPVDRWVNAEFRDRVRETLLDPKSRLQEFFRPEVYRPLVEAFCNGRSDGGYSREAVLRQTIFLLSVHLHLADTKT
jgi:asparagine synthase (glutamine-hydrolysing)